MGVQVSIWAKAQTVGGPSKKLILLVLADRASDDEWATFVGQETIAREAEVTTKTVSRVLSEFESVGLLTRQRRYRKGGYRTSDLIVLNREWNGLPDVRSSDNESGDILSGDNLSGSSDQGSPAESRGTEPQETNCQETSAPGLPDIYDSTYRTECPRVRGLTSSSELTEEHPDAAPAEADLNPKAEAERLTGLLADLIAGRGSKRPTVGTREVAAMEALLTDDGRTPAEVEQFIRWLNAGEADTARWWRSTIRDPRQLREKWDLIREQHLDRSTPPAAPDPEPAASPNPERHVPGDRKQRIHAGDRCPTCGGNRWVETDNRKVVPCPDCDDGTGLATDSRAEPDPPKLTVVPNWDTSRESVA